MKRKFSAYFVSKQNNVSGTFSKSSNMLFVTLNSFGLAQESSSMAKLLLVSTYQQAIPRKISTCQTYQRKNFNQESISRKIHWEITEIQTNLMRSSQNIHGSCKQFFGKSCEVKEQPNSSRDKWHNCLFHLCNDNPGFKTSLKPSPMSKWNGRIEDNVNENVQRNFARMPTAHTFVKHHPCEK